MVAPEAGAAPARSGIVGFLLFSHGWTWGWWLVAALVAGAVGGTIWRMPAAAAFYVGGAGVFIGAIVMSWATGGRPALASLARRALDPRIVPARWWPAIVSWYPAITLLAAALMAPFSPGPTIDATAALERVANPPALLAFLGFILLIGPLPEEVGWRGFLLDRLLAAGNGIFAASLIVALAWWSWHLPLGLLPGYFEAFTHRPHPVWQLVHLLPTAVVYTFVFVVARRSILAVIVLHFMGNLSGQMLEPSDAARLARLFVEAGAAVVILTLWRPKGMARREGRQ